MVWGREQVSCVVRKPVSGTFAFVGLFHLQTSEVLHKALISLHSPTAARVQDFNMQYINYKLRATARIRELQPEVSVFQNVQDFNAQSLTNNL